MPNEAHIRLLARQVIHAGALPRRDPDRFRSGTGVGVACAVCQTPITRTQMEHELQFAHDGAAPGLDRFHFHFQCFAAWETERTRVIRTRATPSPASDHMRQPFTLAGVITAWDAVTRELTILGHTLQVESRLATVALDLGRPVMVAGYRELRTGGMVVTRLLVT